MFGSDEEKFTYTFEAGINYFKGANSSGKTEFYNFIDFMFGSSEDIRKKPWYKDSLEKATMVFEFNNIKYVLTRTKLPEQNYLNYEDEPESESIDLTEYKDRLNAIFTKDEGILKDIRNFTDEDLTYRSFTMFNFLGEKRQGAIHDFFDKCSDVRYSIKLAPILNFIFNKNLEELYNLKHELESLMEEVQEIEVISAKYDFVCKQVNDNLQKLDATVWYTGKNDIDIRKQLKEIKEMKIVDKRKPEKNIADLEVLYNNISEQIKIYENSIGDTKQIEKDNSNRKLLLEKLAVLVEQNNAFEYLVAPLKKLASELDNSISFSKYLISDNTIKELKKQRDMLKQAIKSNDARFKCFSLEEKAKSIALIEDYLATGVYFDDEELKEKRRRIRELREEIKALQNADDTKKIKNLSEFITALYQSAKDISSVVDDDIKNDGFKIQYIKRGNILQPMILENSKDEYELQKNQEVNYYIGSMARHTLMQLCGYLGFLDLLISEDRYPLIPILVIDHISKPFDESNRRAIGAVLGAAYERIGKDKLQTFMFDDEEFASLSIQPEHHENLITDLKTGFNPFYQYANPNEKGN